MAIHPHTHSPSPKKKVGILTALLSACGEADVQPSLLPAHFSTDISLCQGYFMRNFCIVLLIISFFISLIILMFLLYNFVLTLAVL